MHFTSEIASYAENKLQFNKSLPHSADKKPLSQDRAVCPSTFFLRTFWKFICNTQHA